VRPARPRAGPQTLRLALRLDLRLDLCLDLRLDLRLELRLELRLTGAPLRELARRGSGSRGFAVLLERPPPGPALAVCEPPPS